MRPIATCRPASGPSRWPCLASIATVFNMRGGPVPFEQVADLTPEEGGAPELRVPSGPA